MTEDLQKNGQGTFWGSRERSGKGPEAVFVPLGVRIPLDLTFGTIFRPPDPHEVPCLSAKSTIFDFRDGGRKSTPNRAPGTPFSMRGHFFAIFWDPERTPKNPNGPFLEVLGACDFLPKKKRQKNYF